MLGYATTYRPQILIPTNIFFKTMSEKDGEDERELVKESSIHSRDASEAFLKVAQARLKTRLKDATTASFMIGQCPTTKERFTNFIK